MTLCSSSLRFAGVSAATKMVLGVTGRQKVFDSHAVQVHLDALGGVIGIEQHVDAGQAADRLVNNLSVFGPDPQRDRGLRNRSQFHRPGRLFHPLGQPGFGARLGWGRTEALLQQGAAFVGHLLRDEAGRVDGDRLFEVGKGLLQFAGVHQDLALMNIRRRRQKTHVFVRGTVGQVCRLELIGLVVKVVGRDVILAGLGVLAFLEELLGFFICGGEGRHRKHCQQRQQSGKPFHPVPYNPEDSNRNHRLRTADAGLRK